MSLKLNGDWLLTAPAFGILARWHYGALSWELDTSLTSADDPVDGGESEQLADTLSSLSGTRWLFHGYHQPEDGEAVACWQMRTELEKRLKYLGARKVLEAAGGRPSAIERAASPGAEEAAADKATEVLSMGFSLDEIEGFRQQGAPKLFQRWHYLEVCELEPAPQAAPKSHGPLPLPVRRAPKLYARTMHAAQVELGREQSVLRGMLASSRSLLDVQGRASEARSPSLIQRASTAAKRVRSPALGSQISGSRLHLATAPCLPALLS